MRGVGSAVGACDAEFATGEHIVRSLHHVGLRVGQRVYASNFRIVVRTQLGALKGA